MKNVIVFGTNQFSELLTWHLEKEQNTVIAAYTVDGDYIGEDSMYKGKPVVPFEKVEELYPPEQYGIYICVGYNNMNQVRERVFVQAKEKGYHILSYVHPTATVLTDDFGEGNIIMERALIGAFVKVGSGNVFWPDTHVAHHTVIGDFNFFTISSAVAGNIIIGNNCFFGNNCTIRDGIAIANYTLVGAGCYLSESTEPYSVYVPARSVQLEGKSSLEIRGLKVQSKEKYKSEENH